MAEVEWNEESWGDHWIRLRSGLADGPFRESLRPIAQVKLVAFDECIQQIPLDLDRVGLVWMDIQDHEGHMLAGASSLTERTIPVALESWPYGLWRSDGLTLLYELIARHYSKIH
jgi:hypothetical protein